MTVLTVGTGEQYATISSAVAASRDGDVLEVKAGTYTNDFSTINTKITIEGIGGMVHLVATVAPPDGKAIMTINTDATIDHLEFSGAVVASNNGAGIRYQGGNLTLTNDYFHNNQNGLLGGIPSTGAGTGSITISNTEFANNGAGDGYSHNLYVGDIASLNVNNSYFTGAIVGHEIKSRAESTTITNSRIQDGPTGTASYSIDLPNGGKAVITNNVIEKGPNSQNGNFIETGVEGGVHANSSLTLTGNTILNDKGSARLDNNADGEATTISGNALWNLSTSQIVSGPATVAGNTTLSSEPALNTSSPITSVIPVPVTTVTPPAIVSGPIAPPPVVVVGPGSDTLVLTLSEDAYLGNAQFTATIDGKSLGPAQSVTALNGPGQTEAFTYTGTFAPGPHTVGVSFLNDAYGGTAQLDRNLYVKSVAIDGAVAPQSSASLLTAKTVSFAIPNAPSTPVTTAAAAPSDTLVLNLSEDAYLGNAQFIATLDGQPLGAPQSVTALHTLGQSQAFTFAGNFGTGSHDLAISFINDAYGGTPALDRNLYVSGASFDGVNQPGVSANMMANATKHFTV